MSESCKIIKKENGPLFHVTLKKVFLKENHKLLNDIFQIKLNPIYNEEVFLKTS